MKRSRINMTFEAAGLILIFLGFGWIGFGIAFLFSTSLKISIIQIINLLRKRTIQSMKSDDDDDEQVTDTEDDESDDDDDDLLWEEDSEESHFQRWKNVKIDHLSVGWINEIVSKFWYKCLSPRMTSELVQKMLDEYCKFLNNKGSKWSSFFTKIVIEEVSLLECPFQITQIFAEDDPKQERLILKMGVIYPGSGRFSLKWRHPELELGSAKNLGLAFKLKVVLGPFHRDFTILNGLSVSLLERPVLILEGEGIFYLPVKLTMEAVGQLMHLINWMLLDPKCISFQLPTKGFHYPVLSKAEGVLNVLLVEGRDIVKVGGTFKEIGIPWLDKKYKLSASDVFCILRLGKTWMKTDKIKKSYNPVWNAMVQFPMMIQDFARDLELIVEVWDDNTLTYNELLGLTSVNLSNLDREDQSIRDISLKVSCAEVTGELRMMTQFIPCCDTRVGDGAILVIFIKSIKSTQPIEPVVAVQISGKKLYSTAKGGYGHNHEFFEEIPLVVKDVKEDLLRIGVHNVLSDQLISAKYFRKSKKADTSVKDYMKDNYLKRPVIGDRVYPVNFFHGRDGERFCEYMNQYAEIDVCVEFEVQMFPLENTNEDLQDKIETERTSATDPNTT